ncbi:hypothetical protein PGTUg99_027075 [Puccinia graminis f. sp. tritici]|uniref:Uncharacterized protein n=1 Tax=Puccinia graminis f. sp. tritici TaxID=56615 RepID=A0A5B0NHJ6_PUCGR|nr:hypothetical protein PGTUg99_027075 [Puccinia graminis f. sp. tritici]
MNPITIIFGIFISLTPHYVIPGSQIACEACRDIAYELIVIGERPASDDCGEYLGGNEVCKFQRSKKYYKCRRESCRAVTVKNKQCQHRQQEPCGHENRFVFEPPITPQSEGSSSEKVVTSEMIGNRQYFHFI